MCLAIMYFVISRAANRTQDDLESYIKRNFVYLQNLSHIDIEYTTQVPFRIRLLTSDGSTTVTALLAGVGGDRVARIRIKDFFPGPEVAESQVSSMALVDPTYLAKVTGIAFESAATTAAPSGTPAKVPM